MPNPYSTGSWLPNLAPQIANFTDNLVRLKTHQDDIDMRGRQLEQSGRQFNVTNFGTETPTPGMPTLAQGTLEAHKETNRIAEIRANAEAQKTQAEINKLGAQFTPFNAASVVGRMKSTGLDKALAPEIEQISEYGKNRTYTFGAAHDDFISNWPQKRADILNRLQDDVSSKIAKDPNYPNTPEGKKAEALMNGIYADETGERVADLIFPGVGRAKALEAAAARSKMGANDWMVVVGPDGKPMLAPASADLTGQTPFVEKNMDPFTAFMSDPANAALPVGEAVAKFKELENTGKSQSKEQLTARALKGDKQAEAILDAMQQRDRELVEARNNSSKERADRQFAVTLRKEFNNLPDVKEFNQMLPKFQSMEKAFAESKKTNNYVAVDQALITLYNKLTDPTSVVRESEYARTAENIPLLNRIKGKIGPDGKLVKGGAGLTDEERGALMTMARLMSDGYKEIRQKRLGEYRQYGVMGGLTEDFLSDSVGGAAQATAAPTPARRAGDVKPADDMSKFWKK